MLLVIMVAGIACASTSYALSTDRDKDLNVTARYQKSQLGNKVGSEANTTVLTGDVNIDQGSLKAHGDEAHLYDVPSKTGKDDGSKRIVLTGKPAHMQQQLDNDGGLMTADANKIDYNTGTNIAELTGNVVVIQQGNSEFRGEHMTYNSNTGAMEGGSQSPGSQVRLKFLPKNKSTPATKPANKPADGKSG
ncbi:MAG: lipopolysaccharide transport periplasmic protein LptA [Dokdonella sp.]